MERTWFLSIFFCCQKNAQGLPRDIRMGEKLSKIGRLRDTKSNPLPHTRSVPGPQYSISRYIAMTYYSGSCTM